MIKVNKEMLEFKVQLGLHLVNFVYLSDDGDNQFVALCEAIPRVGEAVEPESGSTGYVRQIIHKAVTSDYDGKPMTSLLPSVILGSEKPV